MTLAWSLCCSWAFLRTPREYSSQPKTPSGLMQLMTRQSCTFSVTFQCCSAPRRQARRQLSMKCNSQADALLGGRVHWSGRSARSCSNPLLAGQCPPDGILTDNEFRAQVAEVWATAHCTLSVLQIWYRCSCWHSQHTTECVKRAKCNQSN